MSSNQNHQDAISRSSNEGSVALTRIANPVVKQLISPQENPGDDKLNQARDLVTREVQSVVEEDDLRAIEYHNLAKGVDRDAKIISERSFDRSRFQPQLSTSSEAGQVHLDNINRHAQSLYRCWLSCKDAFPSSLTQENWAKDVWKEACLRSDTKSNLLRQDEEFKCSSMKLLNNMRKKTRSNVESLYEFDTSQAPLSITRNATHAQALLAETTFVYREFNFGGRPRYPYQHPVIQRIVNIMWFQNKDDIGIIFFEYFAPIPFEAIALVLTVIECCIDEWSTGTYKESSWKEVHYKTHYLSHLNSLRDFHNSGLQQKGRVLQDDLLKAARTHAASVSHSTTGSGKLRSSSIRTNSVSHSTTRSGNLRSSSIRTNSVEHADELMQHAEILLRDHQTIMRHDDRILAEDRMFNAREYRYGIEESRWLALAERARSYLERAQIALDTVKWAVENAIEIRSRRGGF